MCTVIRTFQGGEFMRPILVVCAIPDEQRDPKWFHADNFIAMREAFADLMRFGQSNCSPILIPDNPFWIQLANMLAVPFRVYTDVNQAINEHNPCVVFIGGADRELEVFKCLKSTDLPLLPIPNSRGAARVMYEDVRDRFLERDRQILEKARFASEVLSCFLSPYCHPEKP